MMSDSTRSEDDRPICLSYEAKHDVPAAPNRGIILVCVCAGGVTLLLMGPYLVVGPYYNWTWYQLTLPWSILINACVGLNPYRVWPVMILASALQGFTVISAIRLMYLMYMAIQARWRVSRK